MAAALALTSFSPVAAVSATAEHVEATSTASMPAVHAATEVIEAAPTARPTEVVHPMRQFYVFSGSYLLFTLTDGALRLIVLLQANQLGFSALAISIMFSLYELMGVFTNLVGGVVGSKLGLKSCLLAGFVCQVVSLGMLMPFRSPADWAVLGSTTVQTVYIMSAQAFAGVAKDLVKLSGKSTGKLVTHEGEHSRLFRLVAFLTGFKNEVKGLGFFFGTFLYTVGGFLGALVVLAGMLTIAFPLILKYASKDLGKSSKKINWASVFRKSTEFNILCMARMFLFGSRDIWFEVVLPIFMVNILVWNSIAVGSFLAGWTIVYGLMQTATGRLVLTPLQCNPPAGRDLSPWSIALAAWIAVVAALVTGTNLLSSWDAITSILVVGLVGYALVFAINSSIHSYLAVRFSDKDKVSMDVGFYYMANAAGRLLGTLLGGVMYTYYVVGGSDATPASLDVQARTASFTACLWGSAVFSFLSLMLTLFLRRSANDAHSADE